MVAPDGAHLRELTDRLRHIVDLRAEAIVTRWDEHQMEY